MELLVSRNTAGKIVIGADEQLLARAGSGDDLTVCIESDRFHHYLTFGNYLVTRDRVTGLGLPHSALQNPFLRSDAKQNGLIQHVFDSRTSNTTTMELRADKMTLINGYTSQSDYTWYSTRRYIEKVNEVGTLQAYGDQFKVLLTFRRTFRMVVKPDIVYFPHQGREYFIKSSCMVLPSQFAIAPDVYIEVDTPLTEDSSYSTVYLNVGSDNVLTIVHKPILNAHQSFEGDLENRTMVTNVTCEHALLVPET